MATSTGKAARRRHGTRFAAKAAKSKRTHKKFGKLPVSESRGNAKAWREGAIDVQDQGGDQ